MTEKWRTYEEVSRHLLNKFSEKLGFKCVEGKQKLPGTTTGTEWEIDAKAITEDGANFYLIECRRYTTSQINQEKAASLAFRIHDTGASGGIFVSPYDLQSGAKKVAQSANIITAKLDPESTTEEYVLSLLNNVFIGFRDNPLLTTTDSFQIKIINTQGEIIDERHGLG